MDAATRLSNWPWVEVRVDCRMCPRRGCYRLARLAAQFGAEMELERLIAVLARDCPYWRSNPSPSEPRCGARFSDWDQAAPPKLERASSPNFAKRYEPMGRTRVLTLVDLPGPMVTIVCEPCLRRGVYRVRSLFDRFGPALPLPSVLVRIAQGCPSLLENTPRCQARYDPAPS